jgi:hypothetical protein
MWKAQKRLSDRALLGLPRLEGTAFNYCKILARERPENIKEKTPLVFTASGSHSPGWTVASRSPAPPGRPAGLLKKNHFLIPKIQRKKWTDASYIGI